MPIYLLLILLVATFLVYDYFYKKNHTLILTWDKSYKVYEIVPYIVLAIVMGLRSVNVGSDTLTYFRFFNKGIINSFEILYNLINNLFAGAGLSFTSMQLFLSLLLMVNLFFGFRKLSTNHLFALFCFVGLIFYAQSMNIIRQYLAISFFIVAFGSLLNKEYITYILYSLLAVLMHSSAIVLIPISLFVLVPLNKKSLIFFFSAMIIAIVGFDFFIITADKMFGTVYRLYLIDTKIQAVQVVAIVVYLLIYIGFMIVAVKLKDKLQYEKNKKISITMWLVPILIALSILAILKGNIIDRCKVFVLMQMIALLPNALPLLNHFKLQKRDKIIIFVAMIVAFMALAIYRLQFIGSFGIIPLTFL